MFIDQITLYCKAGDGGNGCLSFRREAYVPRGGPDGGDGGDGGNVIVRADRNVTSLSHLAGHRHWKAERGGHGQGKLKTGRRGADAVIRVPLGTLVRDARRGHLLKDLVRDGDEVIVARGGRGGHGNKHFATPTHQAPREFEKGHPGQEREILLELKLLADVGLVGKPNAGKSTLLSRLSRAQPRIAAYPFTTRHPHLGVVRVGHDREFVMADIPGLIEGAHVGIGLGHEFLRHVERTRVLVHLVEPSPADGSDPVANYTAIRDELRLYDPRLLERPELIVVTKCELPEAEAVARRLREETGRDVLQVSAVTGKGLPQLCRRILATLDELEATVETETAHDPPRV